MSTIQTNIYINERALPVSIDFDYEPYDPPGEFDPGNSEGICINKVTSLEQGKSIQDLLEEILADSCSDAVWDHINAGKKKYGVRP